jgi:hypothetical protein
MLDRPRRELPAKPDQRDSRQYKGKFKRPHHERETLKRGNEEKVSKRQ